MSRKNSSGGLGGGALGGGEKGGSSLTGVEEPPRFIGNKPVLALKRFANDLETSKNPDATRFREINRVRVDNFIKKPMDDVNKLHEEYNPKQEPHHRSSFYDYSDHKKQEPLHNLDAPELQRSLGPRSRFGDGDGSFWDKWINTDMPSKGLGVDESGHPISGLSEVATSGFKRLYMNRSDGSDKPRGTSKPRTRLIVQPYSDRKAKRLSEEKQVRAQSTDNSSHPSPTETRHISNSFPFGDSESHALSLSDANWSEIEKAVDEVQGSHPSIVGGGDVSVQLPPISALERDAYFGKKARAEFLDIYRQLSRQQHAFKDSQFITNSPQLPAIAAANAAAVATAKTPKKKLARGKSGRFLASQDNSAEGSKSSASSSSSSRPSVQSFGKSGILVRTNTSTDSDLIQSEVTEAEVLKPHLSKPQDPGAFGRPLSPRSRFLLGCLSTGVAPRPSLLIRKEVTATLNLEHQCMGDHGGILLAESLKDLPYLAELNIRDNKLTDTGLTAIIHSLRDCPSLTSLDVSENKIDDEAAAAISSYLTSPDCKLVTLVLRKSDVDDNEIGRFIRAILMCETLRDIDLSSNLLGSNQNRTPLHPELTSGGQVLGDLLQDKRCKIQSLKLAWNMIRFDSAVALMYSLRSAHSLTDLDLSYNGIGQDGAEVLGNSLHCNSHLRRILLSNNNITPRGCFCICTGIRTNQTLQLIDLSNNPIGEKGLHAAMMLVTEMGDKITVDLRGCSIRTKDSTCWYSTVRPDDLEDYPLHHKTTEQLTGAAAAGAGGGGVGAGAVVLNLSAPYDRAVAIDLLRVAARSRGRFKLDSLKLLTNDPKTDPRALAAGQLLQLQAVTEGGAGAETGTELYLQSVLPSKEHLQTLAVILSPGNRPKLLSDIERLYLEITKPYERNKKLTVLLTSRLFQRLGLCSVEESSSTRASSAGTSASASVSASVSVSVSEDWIVFHLFSAFDSSHEGLVSLEEIKSYLTHFIPEYLSERQSSVTLFNDPTVFYKHPSPPSSASVSVSQRYLPPESGYLHCIPTVSYDPTRERQPTGHTLLSKFHMDNILLSLSRMDNIFHGCETSLLNCALQFPEAWSIYHLLLKDVGDKRMIVRKLLPLLANQFDARLFLYQALEGDRESRVNLRLAMGPLYKLCVGQLTGHYLLNLTSLSDRRCFEFLWDVSKNSVKRRRESSLGDVSQAGDPTAATGGVGGGGSCFRNVTVNSAPLPSLSADHFLLLLQQRHTQPQPQQLPQTQTQTQAAIVEFDFVHFESSKGYGSAPLSDLRFHEILRQLGLFPHPRDRGHGQGGEGEEEEEDEIVTAMAFDDLLRQSFNIEEVQRDVDQFSVPGEEELLNQMVSSHLDGDRLLDYLKWCEEALPRRERIPFPKKYAPPPKTAPKPPTSGESKSAFARGGPWKSSAMFSRSFDDFEVDSPRGTGAGRGATPPRAHSRAVTPRQNSQQAAAAAAPPPAPPLSAELVIETIGFQNISCQQLSFLLHRMSVQDRDMFSEGLRRAYGSTRVEVVIALYNQISDIANLPCLLKHLTIHERACLVFRLGWLNLWSPLRPNGIFHLRFHQREERQMIRLLIVSSLLASETEWKSAKVFAAEGGAGAGESLGGTGGGVELAPNENGCLIPTEWQKEEGLPSRGVLSVEYQSKESDANVSSLSHKTALLPPLLAYVLPTLASQEEKLQGQGQGKSRRDNVTTTHCQFVMHNTGLSLQL